MSDFPTWYNNIPKFTRYWLSATFAVSVLGKLGILPTKYLYLNFDLIFYDFQIWRPITALFFYPLSFHFLINCYFLYNYSSRLENEFKQTPADYLVLLIFNWIGCVICGLFFNIFFILEAMVLSVLYVWCQLNKDLIVSFWFGTKFKAVYLPWVLCAFNWIVSSDAMFSLIGILVGHLYYFLKYQYPQELGGNSFLETPNFLKSYFPDVNVVTGFGIPPQRPTQANPPPASNRLFGNAWGRGNTLGRD